MIEKRVKESCKRKKEVKGVRKTRKRITKERKKNRKGEIIKNIGENR